MRLFYIFLNPNTFYFPFINKYNITDSPYYYENNVHPPNSSTSPSPNNSSSNRSQNQHHAIINQEIRSPLAATRANSLVGANSPTDSADCTKSEPQTSDIFLV